MLKRFMSVCALSFAIVGAGCATFDASPATRLDQAQAIYNSALERLVAMRAPCVPTDANPEYGPAHAQCLLSDDAYGKIEPVRDTADRCIDDASAALAAGDDDSAGVYLRCAEGAAAALADYLLTER